MIRYVLEKEQDVAAVVAEPTRAVPYIPPPGFWKQVRTACDEFGAKLIFDEIPTGLGKTGRFFSCEWEGVVPDILVTGKSLGGGILPVAAMIARDDLNILGDYAYGHYTHEKNPVLCRAALETIQIIQDEQLVDNALRVGEVALSRLRGMQARFEPIGDVRGRGCLFGVELVRDRESRDPDNHLADAILYQCLERGLSFKTTMGNVLTFTPPLVTTAGQMHQAMDILEQAFSAQLND
jgi:4-aminobutyrate aminotransferase